MQHGCVVISLSTTAAPQSPERRDDRLLSLLRDCELPGAADAADKESAYSRVRRGGIISHGTHPHAAGMLFEMQLSPPPPALTGSGLIPTTFRPGSNRRMVATACASSAATRAGLPGLLYWGTSTMPLAIT